MSDSAELGATIEWFGASTFRLKARGLTIFLDAWLERPKGLPLYLPIDNVDECDYIFISHAHFDHLPGADRLAQRTGAIIVANAEAIHVMREAGVPESQLMAVSGGERIPLFTLTQRQKAFADHTTAGNNQDGLPPRPQQPGPVEPSPALAPIAVHVWPSLHCLMPPGDHRSIPEAIDSGTVYMGSGDYEGTMDITRGLKYGLGGLVKLPHLPSNVGEDMRRFIAYLQDNKTNQCSFYDGGQLLFNFLIGNQTLLWNSHLGGYSGILKEITPRPDVAILGLAGRANLNGRPFDGSAAEFVNQELKWLGEPRKVIWCLHDQGALNPKYTKTDAATAMVERETSSKVTTLSYDTPHAVFE
ncbi:hypothetical protein BJY01DRAFT_261173 [Aspergillus pseudoustus]|uniref:Metallo-beta-lactamase domain-containing protein n=1 Tax=Aspergillus pseudoustus TaxID=1810923 RepID=A0ABR4IPF4_9EURO